MRLKVYSVDDMLKEVKNEEDFIDTSELLEDIHQKTNKLDDWRFEALICMLIEEYCKANDMDVIEMGNEIATAIREINEAYGRY